MITILLALYFGPDFKTYEDEIEFIGISSSIVLFGPLIRVAQFLGATKIAKEIAAIGIALEIILGYLFLGNNNK